MNQGDLREQNSLRVIYSIDEEICRIFKGFFQRKIKGEEDEGKDWNYNWFPESQKCRLGVMVLG